MISQWRNSSLLTFIHIRIPPASFHLDHRCIHSQGQYAPMLTQRRNFSFLTYKRTRSISLCLHNEANGIQNKHRRVPTRQLKCSNRKEHPPMLTQCRNYCLLTYKRTRSISLCSGCSPSNQTTKQPNTDEFLPGNENVPIGKGIRLFQFKCYNRK